MTMWKIKCFPQNVISFREEANKPVICPHCGTADIEVAEAQ